MHQSILNCIKYYAIQGKALTLVELRRYMNVKTTIKHLYTELGHLVDMGTIMYSAKRYTLSPYARCLYHWEERDRNTKDKLHHIAHFLKILKKIPWVESVYLTGSCGISNAQVADDIDLMIVTSEKRLFTTRLIVMFLATATGVKRRRGVVQDPNTVCMNLWIDVSRLSVPKAKRSLYAAREIAQMQLLYERHEGTSRQYMLENKWVGEMLPNAFVEYADKKSPIYKSVHKSNMFLDLIEGLAKKLQLKYIKMHQTTELITETQLWFHPLDRSKLC